MNVIIADVALVNGAGFEATSDGWQLSARSLANAQKAGELLANGYVRRILCSGRGPVNSEAYTTSEAALMHDHLVDGGVDAGDILVEDESHSTLANWAFSAPLIESVNAESVVGIASPSQCSRGLLVGKFVASKSQFEVVGYHRSLAGDNLKDYMREFIMRVLTRGFIACNTNTPRVELVDRYNEFLHLVNADRIKRFVHRKVHNF